jgi:hypothetical protein
VDRSCEPLAGPRRGHGGRRTVSVVARAVNPRSAYMKNLTATSSFQDRRFPPSAPRAVCLSGSGPDGTRFQCVPKCVLGGTGTRFVAAQTGTGTPARAQNSALWLRGRRHFVLRLILSIRWLRARVPSASLRAKPPPCGGCLL